VGSNALLPTQNTIHPAWANAKVGGQNEQKIGAVAPVTFSTTLFRICAGGPAPMKQSEHNQI